MSAQGQLDSHAHMSIMHPKVFVCRDHSAAALLPEDQRHRSLRPAASIFKPTGIPMHEIEEVVMTLDEFEALRQADLVGLYQEQAAEQMGVSRPTFSRIIESAHRKVADALVHGKALRIEGGPVHHEGRRCCELHDKKRPSIQEK